MLHVKSKQLHEPRLFLILTFLLVIAVLIFYFVSSMVTSIGYQTAINVPSKATPTTYTPKKPTIIIDAGHGGEDPGAVANGAIEKDLNLKVAKATAEYLALSGFPVLLTRTEDRLLYNDGEDDRKKYYDLVNRMKVAEAHEDAIFISVHMNKFPMVSCTGLQTFYSVNHRESEILAKSVQDASCILLTDNHRQIKPDQGNIFLLKNLKTPAILVECGFLSNQQEALLLSQPEYQSKLSFVICCGIINFLKEYQNNKST